MDRPIPVPRRLGGLLAAAVAAWAMLALPVLAPAALSAVRNAVLRPDEWRSEVSFVWGGVAVFGGFGLPLALAATFALGMPLWAVLERRGWRSRRVAMGAGAAAGGALALGYAVLVLALVLAEGLGRPTGSGPPVDATGQAVEGPSVLAAVAFWGAIALWMALSGAVAGWAAWRVATRRRPTGAAP